MTATTLSSGTQSFSVTGKTGNGRFTEVVLDVNRFTTMAIQMNYVSTSTLTGDMVLYGSNDNVNWVTVTYSTTVSFTAATTASNAINVTAFGFKYVGLGIGNSAGAGTYAATILINGKS
jgi:hypothetical protein